MELLQHYFPQLTTKQIEQFQVAAEYYRYWNKRINLISRKDIEALEVHHFLHSLAIAKAFPLQAGKVLDFGTGGGFPGIPLAILYPQISFHLVDSIQKKVNVVHEVCTGLGLQNTHSDTIRVEHLKEKYDYITCRAVAPLAQIYQWTKHLYLHNSKQQHNGWILLKGGNLHEEISQFGKRLYQIPIQDFFKEAFFEQKYVLHFN